MIRRPLKGGRACNAVILRQYYSLVSPHGSLLKLLIKMAFASICLWLIMKSQHPLIRPPRERSIS